MRISRVLNRGFARDYCITERKILVSVGSKYQFFITLFLPQTLTCLHCSLVVWKSCERVTYSVRSLIFGMLVLRAFCRIKICTNSDFKDGLTCYHWHNNQPKKRHQQPFLSVNKIGTPWPPTLMKTIFMVVFCYS